MRGIHELMEYSNHSWQLDVAVLKSPFIDRSGSSNDCYNLAVVSDSYSGIFLGYGLSFAGTSEVAVLGLSHASRYKNYPSNYNLHKPWTVKSSPAILVIDASISDYPKISTYLCSFSETRNIKLLRIGTHIRVLHTSPLEWLLQKLNYSLKGQQGLAGDILLPSNSTTACLTEKEFECLLMSHIFSHNSSSHPRLKTKTRHQMYLTGLISSSDFSLN